MAESIKVDLELSVANAIKQLDSFAKGATKSLGSVEDSLGFLKNLEIAKLAVEGFHKISEAIAETVKEANESDQAIARLNVSLQASGDYSQASSAHFQDLAKSIQKTSTFSDDQALSLISLAKAYGVSNDKVDGLVKASVDLAAVTGQSLESAFTQLEGTLQGNIGALGKRFAALKLMSDGDLRSGEAIQKVGGLLKGAAEALADTYGGAAKQAENSQADFRKEVGKIITQSPVVIQLLKEQGKNYENLAQAVEENAVVIRDYVEQGIIFLAQAYQDAIGATQLLIRAFGGLQTAGESTLAGIADLGAEFLEFIHFPDIINVVINKLVNLGQTAIDAVRGFIGFTQVGDQIKETGSAVGNLLKSLGVNTEAISGKLADVSIALGKIDDKNLGTQAVEGLKAIRDEANKAGDEIFAQADHAAHGLDSVYKRAGEVVEALKDAADGGEAIGTSIKKGANSGISDLDRLKLKIKENLDKLQEIAKGFTVVVDISKVKQDLSEFAQSIPVTIAAIQAKNQKAVDAMFAKIPAALDKVRQASDKEGQEKLKALQESRNTELQTVQDKAKADLAANISSLNQQLARGEITQQQLVDQRAALEAASAADIAKATEAFQADTEKKLAAQREANALATVDKVAAEEKRLQDEIAAFKLKIEDDVANKRLELEDELAKKRADADKAALDAAGKILGQVGGFFVNTFLPGLGQVADTIIQGLAKGGKFLQDGFLAIAQAIPQVIANLAQGVLGLLLGIATSLDDLVLGIIGGAATFITTLVEGIPNFILTLIDAVPSIIQALVEAAPRLIIALQILMPLVALKLASALIEHAPDIIGSLAKGVLQGVVTGILAGFEAIINGFISFLDSLPFVDIAPIKLPRVTLATGGTVPKGFSGDNFPASLQSGEMVVPRQDTDLLREFLNKEASGNTDSKEVSGKLDRLIAVLTGSSQDLTVNLVVGERELAKTMLNINKQGFRTA